MTELEIELLYLIVWVVASGVAALLAAIVWRRILIPISERTRTSFDTMLLEIPHPSPALAAWRWTICTGLHAGCSLIGGLGLARIWKDVWARRGRARQSLGFPYLVTAVVIHGTYNGLVLLFYIAGLTF